MEYEIKFKLKNKKQILDQLKALKAEDLGKNKEVDIYFQLANKTVRIRKIGKVGLITIKKAVDEGLRAKVREEIEARVNDIDNLIKIFKELGFYELKRKEKIRQTFKLKNSFILIDKLPFMGYFLELEASSEMALKIVSAKLGLDYNKASGNSYDQLFLAYYIKNAKKFNRLKAKILPTFESEKIWQHK